MLIYLGKKMEVYQHIGFIKCMRKTLIVFEQGPAIDEPEYQEIWDPDKKISIIRVGKDCECR